MSWYKLKGKFGASRTDELKEFLTTSGTYLGSEDIRKHIKTETVSVTTSTVIKEYVGKLCIEETKDVTNPYVIHIITSGKNNAQGRYFETLSMADLWKNDFDMKSCKEYINRELSVIMSRLDELEAKEKLDSTLKDETCTEGGSLKHMSPSMEKLLEGGKTTMLSPGKNGEEVKSKKRLRDTGDTTSDSDSTSDSDVDEEETEGGDGYITPVKMTSKKTKAKATPKATPKVPKATPKVPKVTPKVTPKESPSVNKDVMERLALRREEQQPSKGKRGAVSYEDMFKNRKLMTYSKSDGKMIRVEGVVDYNRGSKTFNVHWERDESPMLNLTKDEMSILLRNSKCLDLCGLVKCYIGHTIVTKHSMWKKEVSICTTDKHSKVGVVIEYDITPGLPEKECMLGDSLVVNGDVSAELVSDILELELVAYDDESVYIKYGYVYSDGEVLKLENSFTKMNKEEYKKLDKGYNLHGLDNDWCVWYKKYHVCEKYSTEFLNYVREYEKYN